MTNLTVRSVTSDPAAAADAQALYLRAFPEVEQMPWELLVSETEQGLGRMCAFYDGDTFAGHAFYTATDKVVYLLFLAVNDQVRSRGYGSAILAWLNEQHPGCSIALEIEPMDPTADNWEQRQARLRFYERNGFTMTPYDLHEDTEVYTVLSTADPFVVEDFEATYADIDLGAYTPVLDKVR